MTRDSAGEWLERHQGLIVAIAIVLLAAVAGLGWIEARAERSARERELADLAAALREQAAAIEGQQVVMAERLRLDYLPAPRILLPEPFANRGAAAVVTVAAQNAVGPARDARLVAILLCCARLESLAFKPDSALLVESASPEVRPLLAVGDTMRHEIVLEPVDHPVRRTVRDRLEQSVWLWVGLRYREPLSLGEAQARERVQALSFVWDGASWTWATAGAEQHAEVEKILGARGLLEPGASD